MKSLKMVIELRDTESDREVRILHETSGATTSFIAFDEYHEPNPSEPCDLYPGELKMLCAILDLIKSTDCYPPIKRKKITRIIDGKPVETWITNLTYPEEFR